MANIDNIHQKHATNSENHFQFNKIWAQQNC